MSEEITGRVGAPIGSQPFDPPPPRGPEYLGQTPHLSALEWRQRSAHHFGDPGKHEHACRALGINGFGQLIIGRQDARVTIVQDEKRAALACLCGMPFTWTDINGLSAVQDLMKQQGAPEGLIRWLSELRRRLVPYLPPKGMEVDLFAGAEEPALVTAPREERLAAGRALLEATTGKTPAGAVAHRPEPEPDPLDAICRTKKYKDDGLTWREVAEKDPKYAEWVVTNMDSLDEVLRSALEDWLIDNLGDGDEEGGGGDDRDAQGAAGFDPNDYGDR